METPEENAQRLGAEVLFIRTEGLDPFDPVWIIKSKTLRVRHNVRVRLYQDLLSAGWDVSEFVTSFSNYVIIEL
jgi:hypothetical protein